MTKTFILISGLPATGKDTVANYFERKGFFIMTYSSMILKPIIENPQKKLREFLLKTIDLISEDEILDAINHIEELKKEQSGRELYISVGAVYLKELISKLTWSKFKHFSLFCSLFYETEKKVVVAGFRMKEEIDTLNKLYPDATIVKVLLKVNDEIRYSRIVSRDGIDKKIIDANEKYERETTYDKLLEDINFDIIVENNGSVEELEKNLDKLIF